MTMKHLQLRGDTFYFQKRIPTSIQHLYGGKQTIKRTLHTSDIKQAKKLRDKILGEMAQLEMESPSKARTLFKQHVANFEADKKSNPQEWDAMRHYTGDECPAELAAYRHVASETPIPIDYQFSLREALKGWQEAVGKSKSADTQRKASTFTEEFLKYLRTHDVALSQITRGMVTEFHTHQADSGYAKTTVQGKLSALKMLWKYANDRDFVHGDNPFSNHSVGGKASIKRQLMTAEEISSVMADFKQHVTPNMYLAALTSLWTGARISEVSRLTKDLVKDGCIYIEHGKNDRARRVVPIPDWLYQLLKSQTSKEFVLADGKEVSRLFSRSKTRVVADETKTLHTFRNLISTCALRADIPETIASQIVGHTNKGVSLTYGHYARGDELQKLKNNYDKIAAKLEDYLGEHVKSLKSF
ncbi:DUF6538 domain-containing protein [Thalassotalea litorea]|uniref:DUF6538 domain-containing protein n=1 Tax=Thalassotalea litorea TaxID=2020715 RepID=UPI0037370647